MLVQKKCSIHLCSDHDHALLLELVLPRISHRPGTNSLDSTSYMNRPSAKIDPWNQRQAFVAERPIKRLIKV